MRTTTFGSVLAVLALVGCGAPDAGLENGPELLPSAQLPTANSFFLSATPAKPGAPITLTVAGAPANANVDIAFTRSGVAAPGSTGWCPAFVGGVCFDLLRPVRAVGQLHTDGVGQASATFTFPASFAVGDQIWIQGVVIAGAATDTSNAVAIVVTDDGDGDGYCEGMAPCLDPSASPGDCDDLDAHTNPGAVEVCGGLDEDCDGTVDEADAWWDTDWAYRLPIAVTGSATYATKGLPVSVDVDFDALLGSLGDGSGLDPDSVRVVYQSCGAGQPELASEFADDLWGIFDKVDSTDPVGDDAGAVVFLYDTDGDYASLDTLPAGASGNFAIYFGSNAHSPGAGAPAYTSTLVTSTDGITGELSNARTESLFAAGQGGLTTRTATVGRPTTGAQTSSVLGNGIYFGTTGAGSWVTAKNDTAASLSLVHDGPVLGALRAEGAVSNAYGGFAYSYTYYQFDGRPELYSKVVFELDRASNIGPQATFWGAAVRPWMANNNALASAALSEGGADIPGYTWVRGGYATGGASPYGIAVGYRNSVALRSRPIYDATGTSDAGRYVGLAGQDLSATFVSGATSRAGVAGEVVVDHSIVAVYPHQGLFSAVSVDFLGTLDGSDVVMAPVEAQ